MQCCPCIAPAPVARGGPPPASSAFYSFVRNHLNAATARSSRTSLPASTNATALPGAPAGSASSCSALRYPRRAPVGAAHNSALKRSANGVPPGPGRGALHSPQPGPGVTPSSPA